MKQITEQEKRWLLEEKYNGIHSLEYFQDVEKIEDGYPVAYIIGNIPFLNCHIDLSKKPLIPRPETEFWVDKIVKEYKKFKNLKVLDLFSGSGCIGLSILKNIDNSYVDFGELNSNFVYQIKINLELNSIEKNRFGIFQTDVFSKIPESLKYDLILTNPPYIDENKKDTVQDSVVFNEDHGSLFAPDEGMLFIKKIIDKGFKYLKDKGKIYIEYDPQQIELIEKYLIEKGMKKYHFQKDQFDKCRVVIIEK